MTDGPLLPRRSASQSGKCIHIPLTPQAGRLVNFHKRPPNDSRADCSNWTTVPGHWRSQHLHLPPTSAHISHSTPTPLRLLSSRLRSRDTAHNSRAPNPKLSTHPPTHDVRTRRRRRRRSQSAPPANQLHLQAPPTTQHGADLAVRAARDPDRGQDPGVR